MNWLILFLYFSILLVIVFIKLSYFFFNTSLSVSKKDISLSSFIQKI